MIVIMITMIMIMIIVIVIIIIMSTMLTTYKAALKVSIAFSLLDL